MDECRGYKYTSAKVSREEERIAGYWEVREASDHNGKGAGGGAQEKNEEEREDVQWGVVGVFRCAGAARWSLASLLSADQFGMQGVDRYVRPGGR